MEVVRRDRGLIVALSSSSSAVCNSGSCATFIITSSDTAGSRRRYWQQRFLIANRAISGYLATRSKNPQVIRARTNFVPLGQRETARTREKTSSPGRGRSLEADGAAAGGSVGSENSKAKAEREHETENLKNGGLMTICMGIENPSPRH